MLNLLNITLYTRGQLTFGFSNQLCIVQYVGQIVSTHIVLLFTFKLNFLKKCTSIRHAEQRNKQDWTNFKTLSQSLLLIIFGRDFELFMQDFH